MDMNGVKEGQAMSDDATPTPLPVECNVLFVPVLLSVMVICGLLRKSGKRLLHRWSPQGLSPSARNQPTTQSKTKEGPLLLTPSERKRWLMVLDLIRSHSLSGNGQCGKTSFVDSLLRHLLELAVSASSEAPIPSPRIGHSNHQCPEESSGEETLAHAPQSVHQALSVRRDAMKTMVATLTPAVRLRLAQPI